MDNATAVRRALADLRHGCHGIVTRDGEQDACGKPVTVLIDGRHGEAESIWPACTYHGNRYGGRNVIALRLILGAIEAGDQ